MQAAPVRGSRSIATNGVELRTESFGRFRDPTVLLIMGANGAMVRWPETLCRKIAAAGRFVIRYDSRDTGQSTVFPPGKPGYDLRDLARDAVGVLDAYGIERAHVAGFSMGGMIVQHLAIFHPTRVQSALIGASSPEPSTIWSKATGAEHDALSPPWPVTIRLMRFLATVDWSNEQAAVEAWIREELDLLGSGDEADEDATRAIITHVVRDARNVSSHRLNHPVAVSSSPPWRERLKDIRVPTLVFHGGDDAILPVDHARAMAREIPGARLIEVKGMGHILAPSSKYWDLLADALIAHTATSHAEAIPA